MEFHPLCLEYPETPEDVFDEILKDMQEHGYDPQFPIITHEKMILDGRTRYRAAIQLGIEPIFSRLKSGIDPEDFVRRANENRRHLLESWLQKRRKERIKRVAEAAAAGQTEREIAAAEGISAGQAHRDLEASKTGSASPPKQESESTTSNGHTSKTHGAARTPARTHEIDAENIARTERVKVFLKEQPDASNRVAAAACECSEHVVAKVRAELFPPPTCGSCETKKRKGQTVPKGCEECKALRKKAKEDAKPPEPEKPTDVLDAEGHVCKHKAEEAFVTLLNFDDLEQMCKRLQKGIADIALLPGGEQFGSRLQVVGSEEKKNYQHAALNDLKRDLKHSRPHAVCPYCCGKGPQSCKGCAGRGWVSKLTWANIDDDTKARLK